MLFSVAALTLVVTFIGVFAEVALRLAAPQPESWLAVYRRHPRLPVYSLIPNGTAVVDTGEVRWQLFTDAEGFRAASTTNTSPKTASVAIGDSFTFGQGVDFGETFVGILESLTKEPWINAGVQGYGPVQYRQVLVDLLAQGRRPRRVIVVSFAGNDFHDTIWKKDVPVANGVVGDAGDLKSMLKRNLHLYRLVSRVYHILVPTKGASVYVMNELYQPDEWVHGELAEATAVYEREFRKIAEIATQNKIPVYAVLIPTRETIRAVQNDQKRADVDFRRPHEKAAAIFESTGIPWVDLLDDLRNVDVSTSFNGYDGHFSAEGNRIAAQAMLRLISEEAPSLRD